MDTSKLEIGEILYVDVFAASMFSPNACRGLGGRAAKCFAISKLKQPFAVDGLAQALRNAGQGEEALRGMEDVRRLAASSSLGDFAAKIEQKLQLYRSNSVPTK